jgi:hypothetical protein
MNDADREFLAFYEKYRRAAQSTWYQHRYGTYERAHRQSVNLTSFVLFLSSVVSILSTYKPRLSVGNGYFVAWSVLAAVLAATGTAVAAYRALYAFQENAGLYRDAENALVAMAADSPLECETCPDAPARTPGEYVTLVEQVFRREQGQWGQLVAQIRRAAADREGEVRDVPADPGTPGQGPADPPSPPTPDPPEGGGDVPADPPENAPASSGEGAQDPPTDEPPA